MVTTLARIASWAVEAKITDAPTAVVDLCRAQRRSVLAAVAASTGDGAVRRAFSGMRSWAGEGPVRIPGFEGGVRVDDAIYAAAVSAIALDFDDYLCFAHSGHSAVLAPLLLAVETGSSGADQLGAQLVANEVAARLGGACLLGPLNGQLWSFVHAAGAALAAGRLLGLDAGRLGHALAIALYQAPRPTLPGFMAPDTKVLTAAEPTLVGVRAARLAAAGASGPLDLLDHPQGFFGAFAYAPLPAMLGNLGEGWATQTLSIKRYPGCAYLDTALDALFSLGPPPATDVAAVQVDAGVVTCEMDALSRPYTRSGDLSPVTVNFSVPWSLAAALLAGRLSPSETNEDWLAANHAPLSELATRTCVRHDWGATLASAAAMAPLLPPRATTAGASPARLAGALRKVRRDHRAIGFGPTEAAALLRAVRSANLRSARSLVSMARVWDPAALERFAMTFPARVTVRLRDGQQLSGEADVPAGGAGNVNLTPEMVSREKLAEWGTPVWGTDGVEEIAKAIDADADHLWRLLGEGR